MGTLPTDLCSPGPSSSSPPLGVIARPFRLPEAIWAAAGALLLVAFGLLPVGDALAGMRKGVDVYLFLTGMMLIAELARREGFFDWLAALAVGHAAARRSGCSCWCTASARWSPCSCPTTPPRSC